jgi:hypothetical protein
MGLKAGLLTSVWKPEVKDLLRAWIEVGHGISPMAGYADSEERKKAWANGSMVLVFGG